MTDLLEQAADLNRRYPEGTSCTFTSGGKVWPGVIRQWGVVGNRVMAWMQGSGSVPAAFVTCKEKGGE